jgi:PKD repeat protein
VKLLVLLLTSVFAVAFNIQHFTILKAVAYGTSSTYVGGYISENTTWTLDGSPYIVTADVIVESGVILDIDPEVVVKFTIGTNLVIDGALVAEGNTTHPITFTSNSTTPAPGDWGSIRFRDSTDDALCKVSYANIRYGVTGIAVEYASPNLSYLNISDNSVHGIYATYCSSKIEHCFVSKNGQGIFLSWGCAGAVVSNNTLSYNSLDGLTIVWSSSATAEYNTILNNAGRGVCVDGYSPIVRRNIIAGNQVGIFVVNGAPITQYNDISGNRDYGMVASKYYDINAPYNWWGTVNETLIEAYIYDYYDDYNLRKVFYKPYLVPPLVNFTFSPAVPYDCETITFDASASFNPYGSITNYRWDFGDGSITTTTLPIITHTYTSLGNYNITLEVTDEFGLTNNTSTTVTVLEDDILPATTDDYDGLWRNSDFTITLAATDHESGVAETYYRINNGPIKAVSVDGQPLITTESANNTLEYWSIDNAGNKELPHKVLTGIKLDKTVPTIESPSRIPEGDVEPDQEVRILVNATDSLSGVGNVILSYNINNGPVWTNITMVLNTTTGLYEDTIQGQQANTTVKYKIIVYDNAGNLKVEDKNGEFYVYIVIPEFPSTMFLLLFLIVTLALAVFKKKATKMKD